MFFFSLTQVNGQFLRQHSGDVLHDVGIGLDGAAAQDWQEQAAVDLSGRQEKLACQSTRGKTLDGEKGPLGELL